MQIEYTVHSVSDAVLPIKATMADGTVIDAQVAAITYEFAYNDGAYSHTYTVRGSQPEFAVGQIVVAAFAASES